MDPAKETLHRSSEMNWVPPVVTWERGDLNEVEKADPCTAVQGGAFGDEKVGSEVNILLLRYLINHLPFKVLTCLVLFLIYSYIALPSVKAECL